jgi:hypothetical protein
MKLSDFQKDSGRSIAVDEKVMTANAKAAGSQVDWRSTKINAQKGWGANPFAEAEGLAKRCRAMDVEQGLRTVRRAAAHIALDEALDGAENEEPAEQDKDAEPAEQSTQHSQAGGCGKSFTCDSGRLISQKASDEIRRRGLSYGVF